MISGPLRILTLFLLVVSWLPAQTGQADPALAPYDELMTSLIAKHGASGGSLAITRNGRLVYARGFGVTAPDGSIPVQPDSEFRIGSLSKVVTGVAVMKLVEMGKLDLDASAFSYLPDLKAPSGTTGDPRLKDVTVRQLLQHTGGWDRDKAGGYDPVFNSPRIVFQLNVPAPASTENVIRYMLGQPLDNTPGTTFVYSNFGYAVLGRIIERVTGSKYDQWVRANILIPAGATGMRIGQTLPSGRGAMEVNYIPTSSGPTVFADVPGPLPWPYGNWYLESLDAPGGWVANAIEFAKFLNAIDGRRGTRILSANSVTQFAARPSVTPQGNNWYAMGTNANVAGSWWHAGSLDGVATYFIRTNDGYVYVIMLNTRGLPSVATDMDQGFFTARAQVTNWPSSDLFSTFPDADAAGTPSIAGNEGVVNGATFTRGVVPGSWFTIFGSELSTTTRIWTGADIVGNDLPQSLDGISVKIDGKPAFVYYVSPTQINAQAPGGLSPGWYRVEVTRDGKVSEGVMAHVTSNAPGVLTYGLGGRLYAVATNASGTVLGDAALAPGLAAAAPGQTIVIYTTGLATSASGTAAPPATSVPGLQATIGGSPAQITFAGLISPGLFQVNAVIPDVADGDRELVLTVAGARSAEGVVVPVQR